MKIPLRPIFPIRPGGFLDVPRPHPTKPFHSRHPCYAPPVDPIQCARKYVQGLIQSRHGQTRLVENNPSVPSPSRRLLPFPLRHGGGLPAQFPTVIQRQPNPRQPPHKITPPVKYCAAVTPSAMSG